MIRYLKAFGFVLFSLGLMVLFGSVVEITYRSHPGIVLGVIIAAGIAGLTWLAAEEMR